MKSAIVPLIRKNIETTQGPESAMGKEGTLPRLVDMLGLYSNRSL